MRKVIFITTFLLLVFLANEFAFSQGVPGGKRSALPLIAPLLLTPPTPPAEDDWTDYSATSTVTGWLSSASRIIWYKVSGKTVFVQFNISGNSSGTVVAFTLPYAAANIIPNFSVPVIADNGARSAYGGMGSMSIGSYTVFVDRDQNATEWTTGDRNVAGQFFYVIP